MSNFSDQFTLNSFEPADCDAWLALWKEYSEGYEPAGLDPAIAQSNWNALIMKDGRLNGLCLRDAKEMPAGFAHYVFHHCTKSVQPECYLIDLFVSEPMRGQGGGRRLLDSVIADCRNKGISRVTWITRKDNVRSQTLYETIVRGKKYLRYVVATSGQ